MLSAEDEGFEDWVVSSVTAIQQFILTHLPISKLTPHRNFDRVGLRVL